MQYVDRFGHGIHQLLYVSQATERLSGASAGLLNEIVAASNARNRARAITGALLKCGDQFVQVLEGDHVVLKALFEKIQADDRHSHVILKGVVLIEKRMFGRWGMKEGRAPADGFDFNAMDYQGLLVMMKLSVLSGLRNAA